MKTQPPDQTRDTSLDVVLAGVYYCDLIFTGLPRMPELGHEIFGSGFDMLHLSKQIHAQGGLLFMDCAQYAALSPGGVITRSASRRFPGLTWWIRPAQETASTRAFCGGIWMANRWNGIYS